MTSSNNYQSKEYSALMKCKVQNCKDALGLFENISTSFVTEIAANHYENTPIQIYRKFHLQKLKIFR